MLAIVHGDQLKDTKTRNDGRIIVALRFLSDMKLLLKRGILDDIQNSVALF